MELSTVLKESEMEKNDLLSEINKNKIHNSITVFSYHCKLYF